LTLIFAAFVVGVAGNYFVFKSTQFLHIIKEFVDLLSTPKYIASCIMPDLIWLVAGNLNGLSIEKCQVLNGREIILYPDLGAFGKWSLKATEIKKKYDCRVTISTLSEC
jgi:hypothetical protein